MTKANDRAQRGIQSIEVGGQLLLALVHHGRPMALKDLAREAGMAPAKAHPYLVSFARLGLVEQSADSGSYFLGPLALQLGLISLQQATPVQVATPWIADLAQRLGHTVAIAVWGTRGATIVRIEESPAVVHVNMRHGTVFSLANTASGRLFAAYQPPEVARARLEAERERLKRHPMHPWPACPCRRRCRRGRRSRPSWPRCGGAACHARSARSCRASTRWPHRSSTTAARSCCA